MFAHTTIEMTSTCATTLVADLNGKLRRPDSTSHPFNGPAMSPSYLASGDGDNLLPDSLRVQS